MAFVEKLVYDEATNAAIGWLLTGVIALGAVESALTNALLWGGFALFTAVVLVVPALSTGDWMTMVSWPLPLVASLAVVGRAAELYPETMGYVAVATLAVVAVVELDAFTPVEMGRRFAVGFAVLTTMAVQGLWTVAQFYSDRWLATQFLRSQTELQWDFVIVTGVGFVIGGLAELYFRQCTPVGAPEGPAYSAETS